LGLPYIFLPLLLLQLISDAMGNTVFYGIALIILGILAVPSLILSRKPEAKELLNKIIPYQGWIGVVFCILGIWGLINCVFSIGMTSYSLISWIIWLLVTGVQASLGFILGYGLITKYFLSKNKSASEIGEEILSKLLPLQGRLGFVAIVIGFIQIIDFII